MALTVRFPSACRYPKRIILQRVVSGLGVASVMEIPPSLVLAVLDHCAILALIGHDTIHTRQLQDVFDASLGPAPGTLRMLVDEVPTIVRLLLAQHHREAQMDKCLCPRSAHDLWIVVMLHQVQGLPRRPMGAGRRSDQEQWPERTHHVQRPVPLRFELEVPRFAIAGIEARQIQREPRDQLLVGEARKVSNHSVFSSFPLWVGPT